MKTKTQTLITFADLMEHRGHPLNDEHCEAYMKERYQVALQLALIDEYGVSEKARCRFPIITDKDYTLPRLRRWSLEFEHWHDNLRPRDRRAFDSAQFLS